MEKYNFEEAFELMKQGYKFRFIGRKEIVYYDKENDELVEDIIVDYFHKLSHRTIMCNSKLSEEDYKTKERIYKEGIIISKIF